MSGSMTKHTMSEARSKALLAAYGIPLLDERVASDVPETVAVASEIGFPVVAKLCGDRIAHKTERGLVRLGLGDADAVTRAAQQLLGAATPEDGEVGVLVAPMVTGNRELIAGMQRDPQFGPTVMIGIGGILAEVVADVAIGLAPLEEADAYAMIAALSAQKLLGEFRGEPPVDPGSVAAVLTGLSRLAVEHSEVLSVDINPLIVVDGRPVAVDALVEVAA